MRPEDFKPFSEMLDAACGLLSRGNYTPSATNSALWFRALGAYPLDVVRAAFDAHIKDPQRGRFVPTPADVISQIDGFAQDDGRPGAEEAWAMVLPARDEAETVVWTAEMAEAWGVARNVMSLGDEVGARMAFKEAYTRLVVVARQAHTPTSWTASLGYDAERRALAVNSGVESGRLSVGRLESHPAPGRLLTLDLLSAGMPEQIRRQLRELRDQIATNSTAVSTDAKSKAETVALKAKALVDVQEKMGQA